MCVCVRVCVGRAPVLMPHHTMCLQIRTHETDLIVLALCSCVWTLAEAKIEPAPAKGNQSRGLVQPRIFAATGDLKVTGMTQERH